MDNKTNIHHLIELLYKPIIFIAIFLSLSTFIDYFKILGSTGYIQDILFHFNLNKANTIADWFSVLIWIICGLSFFMLGRKRLITTELKKKDKIFLTVFGILVCLISFEKIFHFHLMFEFRAINLLGFFSPKLRQGSPYYWLYIIFIPILIIILINLTITFLRLLRGIKDADIKNKLIYFLVAAIIFIPLSESFDMLQGYFWYEGRHHTVFNSIESVLELIGICCIIGCNKTFAEYYNSLCIKDKVKQPQGY